MSSSRLEGRSGRAWALAFALTALAANASPALQPLTEREAVERTVASSPTLRAALTDVQQAAQSVRAERSRYRPTLLLEASGTTDDAPNLGAQGTTFNQLNQSLVGSAELSQTFSWGTRLALRLENRNTRFSGALFAGSPDTLTLGPGHRFSLRLSVSQPLLRGFGDEVGLAALRSALLQQRDLERSRDSAASEALRAALLAYWELWAAQRSLLIEREARALAVQQRDEARTKQKAGSLADVDLLTFESRLAELDQAVLGAEVSEARAAVELRRALGDGALEAGFELTAAPPAALEEVAPLEAMAQAREASFSIARQRLALESAQLALRTAGEATRPRLDLEAWAQTQGLGNQSVAAAWEQLGRFQALSANVGLTFELPLSGERHGAQVAAARLAVEAARERLLATTLEVEAQTQTELATLQRARANLALALRSAEVSEASARAQATRFAGGAGTALEVRQAEDAVRRARLTAERERVKALEAQVRLAHLTGHLLARWGVALER